MKLLSIIFSLLMVNAIMADTITVPDWVPAKKRVVFIRYIQSVEKIKAGAEGLRKHAEDYRKALSSLPKISSCTYEKNQVHIDQYRHKLKTRIIIMYTMEVESCVVVDNTPEVKFKPKKKPSKVWETIKTVVVYAGIVIAAGTIGYLIGKASG